MVTKKTIQIAGFLVWCGVVLSLVWLVGPTYDGPTIFWLVLLLALFGLAIWSLTAKIPVRTRDPQRTAPDFAASGYDSWLVRPHPDQDLLRKQMDHMASGFFELIRERYRNAPKKIYFSKKFYLHRGIVVLWMRDAQSGDSMIHTDYKVRELLRIFKHRLAGLPFEAKDDYTTGYRDWLGRSWTRITFVYIPNAEPQEGVHEQ